MVGKGRLKKERKFVVTDVLLKLAKIKELSLPEFLVLMYLDNNYSDNFEIELMSDSLNLDAEVCLESFNSLLMKGLVSLDSKMDENDKYKEYVSIVDLEEEKETSEESEIFKVFEEELGRTLSQTELALINGWLMSGTKEELIISALKEAIFNGVTSFRYIDKIIYEWEKKGLKSAEEVNDYLKNRRTERKKDNNKNKINDGKIKKDNKIIDKREQEVLDYDWLNDDDK